MNPLQTYLEARDRCGLTNSAVARISSEIGEHLDSKSLDHWCKVTLIQRCIELFQLLPTSGYRWLIAADWLEEKGAEVEAAAFREGLGESKHSSLDMGALDGLGDGDGNGYGGGDRGGCGGNRTNYGYGFADGAGDGDGTSGNLFRL